MQNMSDEYNCFLMPCFLKTLKKANQYIHIVCTSGFKSVNGKIMSAI